MDRPKSIIWFERLFYLRLAVTFVLSIVKLKATPVPPEVADIERTYPLAMPLLYFVLFLGTYTAFGLLAYSAAHRASKVARWLVLASLVVAVLSFLRIAFGHKLTVTPFSMTMWACELLLIACVWLLFTPASNRWFAGRYAARNVGEVFE